MPTKDEIIEGLQQLSEEERADVIAGALGSNGVTDAVLTRVNANGDKLFTLSQIKEKVLPEHIKQIMPERLKNHVKREDFAALQARHDSAKREIDRLKAEGAQPNPEAQREWERKITDLETSVNALNTELDAEKEGHKDTTTTLRGKILQIQLASALMDAGAKGEYLKHAVPNARRDLPQLTLSDDETLTAMDPTTRRPLDHAEILKGWLAANPIYLNASPSGGGLPPAGPQPPPPPKDVLDGVPTGEAQLAAAVKAGFNIKHEASDK